MAKMDSYDRWQALKVGEKPDRPPISFWRHFYDRENTPDTFAEAMIDFQKRFGFDLVKINPKASYHIEPWGVTVKQPDGPQQKPTKISWPIHKAEDLGKIQPLPVNHPEFSGQLSAVSMIRNALPRPLPIIMTMFTPLSVLGDLVPDNKTLIRLIGEAPEAVVAALEHLTATFVQLAVEFLNAGADGLFFATTEWATSDCLTWEQYERFGRPFDLQVLNSVAKDAAFILLHVCGSNNYLDKFADYPADVVNWDATDPTNLPLRDGWRVLQKPILGGIDRNNDLLGLSQEALADKTRRLVEAHADLPFAVGPGCAVPVNVPLENLEIIKDAVIEAGRDL